MGRTITVKLTRDEIRVMLDALKEHLARETDLEDTATASQLVEFFELETS